MELTNLCLQKLNVIHLEDTGPTRSEYESTGLRQNQKVTVWVRVWARALEKRPHELLLKKPCSKNYKCYQIVQSKENQL